MDLSDISTDTARIEQGEWIGERYDTPIPEMGDLCLKVRGVDNGDWRRLRAKLINAIPRQKRPGGQIDPDEIDRITGVLLLNTALIDWANLKRGGEAVAYSHDQAATLLTDPAFRKFQAAALWAAQQVGERVAQAAGEQVKN